MMEISAMVEAHSAFLEKFLSLALAEQDIDLDEVKYDYEHAMQAGLDGVPMVLTDGLTPFRVYVLTTAYAHGQKHRAEMDDMK